MAQNAPTLASSRRSNDEGPQYMRAEAIAMRRLVAERGWWLSPQFAMVPLPVLTEWEASVELAKVDHNHTMRERQQAKNLLKNRSQYQSAKRNRSQQSTAENVPTTAEAAPRHKGDRHRNYATPSVLDVTIGRATNPWGCDALQARKAHRDTIEEVAQAQGKSPAEVEREDALARITALAAEKAAAHKIAEARKTRLAAAEAKRQARNDDPAEVAAKRKEKNRREAERKQKHRAAARADAKQAQKAAALQKVAEGIAVAARAKQAQKAAARATLQKVAEGIAVAARAKQAQKAAAQATLQKVGEGIAAAARAKRRGRSNAKQSQRACITHRDP